MIYDIFDDTTGAIKQVIADSYIIPDFIKKASDYFENPVEKDSKKQFAYLGKFPMDTPVDVWWSKAFLEKYANSISEDTKKIIDNALDFQAKIFGIDINIREKNASGLIPTIYELNLEDFALTIPKEELSEKFASIKEEYFYRDNQFCIYPLKTDEQIKLANTHFPSGIDDEIEFLRADVAQKIAEASVQHSIDISPKVARYLPMSKIAAISDLENKARLHPELAESYKDLAGFIKSKSDFTKAELFKIASSVENLDNKTNLPSYYNSEHVLTPADFMRGFYENNPDLSGREVVKVAGYNEFPLQRFIDYKEELVKFFPDIESNFDSSIKLASFIKNQLPGVQKVIYQTINSK